MANVVDLVTTEAEQARLDQIGMVYTEVSQQMIYEMNALARDVPSVESNLILLHQAVLGNGIDMRSSGRPMQRDMRDYINQMWLPVLQQYIRHYTIYGFAIISFGRGVPVIVDPSLVQIKFFIDDNFRRKYLVTYRDTGSSLGLFSTSSGRLVKHIVMLEVHPPTETGKLTVPLVSALKFTTYVNAMMACSVRAAARMALPALVTELAPAGRDEAPAQNASEAPSMAARRQALQTPFMSVAEQRRAAARAIADAENKKALEDARKRAISGQAVPMVQVHPDTDCITFPLEAGTDTTFQPRVDIEPGRQAARGPVSAQPYDPVGVISELRRLIGTLMVVPDFIFGGSQHSASHSHVVLMVFFKAQQMHRKLVSELAKLLFFIIFGDHIKQDALKLARSEWFKGFKDKPSKEMEKEFKAFMEDGGSEVFLDVATDIEVFLPTSLDLDLIRTMLAEGILKWDGAMDAVAAYFSIPRSMLHDDPPVELGPGSTHTSGVQALDKSGLGAIPSVRAYVDGAAKQGKRIAGGRPSASSMASVGQVSGGK